MVVRPEGSPAVEDSQPFAMFGGQPALPPPSQKQPVPSIMGAGDFGAPPLMMMDESDDDPGNIMTMAESPPPVGTSPTFSLTNSLDNFQTNSPFVPFWEEDKN